MTGPSRAARPPAGSDMRAAVLAAALAEVAEVGVEQASMRSISRRVGISHQAITYYFANRSALLTAVAIHAWELLTERVRDALGRSTTDFPGAPVITIGSTYIAFARENRARFTLMMSAGVLDQSDELLASQTTMWELHESTVRRENERGWGGEVPPNKLALATYSLAHGLASLEGEIAALVPPGVGEDILLVLNRGIIGS